MAKELKTINIAELIVKSYGTEDVVAFLADKLKKYNSGENADNELALYVDILDALNHKLSGGKSIKVIV